MLDNIKKSKKPARAKRSPTKALSLIILIFHKCSCCSILYARQYKKSQKPARAKRSPTKARSLIILIFTNVHVALFCMLDHIKIKKNRQERSDLPPKRQV